MESEIERLIDNGRRALALFETFEQTQVDQLVHAIGKTIYDHADFLAALALKETGLGVLADKIQKNRGKAQLIWHHRPKQRKRHHLDS
jgi:succinate-semialdehyde dehydrogenase